MYDIRITVKMESADEFSDIHDAIKIALSRLGKLNAMGSMASIADIEITETKTVFRGFFENNSEELIPSK